MVFFLLSCSKTDREDLQVIQKNALHLCLHILDLMTESQLLIYTPHLILLVWNNVDVYKLLSLLFIHSESYVNVFEIPARNSRAADILKYRTEIYKNPKYKNSPYYKAATLWDTLLRQAKGSATLGELKQHLKVL